jgi:DNA-binding transcriptional LysR family regulator
MVELRLYRYFVTLAETLHFGRAAAMHGIAQPPFSQQIQKLERELGTLLLRRSNRHVELTDAGSVFLGEARRTLAAAERAERAARLAGEGRTGRIAIGMISSASYEDMISAIVRRMGQRYPSVDIALLEMTTPQQLQALQSGEVQIGFVRPPIFEASYSTFTVRREPLLLALPSTHRMAAESEIELRSLARDPWVMLPSDMGLGFYEQVIGVCKKAGFTPEAHQVATQIHTMISLVAAGLGVTLVPASVSSMRRTGIVYRRLKDKPEPVETIAVWMPARLSPLLENLLGIIHEVADEYETREESEMHSSEKRQGLRRARGAGRIHF